jgi:hypothetical protein
VRLVRGSSVRVTHIFGCVSICLFSDAHIHASCILVLRPSGRLHPYSLHSSRHHLLVQIRDRLAAFVPLISVLESFSIGYSQFSFFNFNGVFSLIFSLISVQSVGLFVIISVFTSIGSCRAVHYRDTATGTVTS